jgi:hypothetical protein
MALIAEDLGEDVACIVSKEHLEQHQFMKRAKRLWTPRTRSGSPMIPNNIEIYISKADAFYRDQNWAEVSKLPGYKVCLCNSDRCFRESSKPFRSHRGHPVQDRADLYMPVNHTKELLETHGHKVIPTSHPIDPRMYEMFMREGVYYHYLRDELDELIGAFYEPEVAIAGFMGNKAPSRTRIDVVGQFPSWAEFRWQRAASSREFIRWMMQRRGCIDMRGNGDKSLRFSEAAMLGRTLICQGWPSLYYPPLRHGHNCLYVTTWEDLNSTYDQAVWERLAKQSMQDYKVGWSLRAQVKLFIDRARNNEQSSIDNRNNGPNGIISS